MIRRDLYLNQINEFIDKPFIKVITGIRRCGKSAMLYLLKEELRKKGIADEFILHLNFESFELSEFDQSEKLYQYVTSKITRKKRYYIMLDEVQEVKSWEKAVDAFLVDLNADIFITGSNSQMLSSELSTYLAGRYVEIHLYPLSFSEHLFFKQQRTSKPARGTFGEFEDFMRLGGFPVLHTGEYALETAYKVVYDIYSSAILRDTVQRFNIRDVELLERVVKYVFDNVGNKLSAKNIADYFKSQQRKIDLNTVYNYLNALEGAFILYRIPRYDVRGKEILKTQEKYYVADQSLLYAVMGFRDRFISGILENIIMLELKRRGYKVFVGKSDKREIDFIGELRDSKVYIQVAWKMSSQSTIEREFTPLLEVKDHHPKYVVTMDESFKENLNGIRHVHIADFLLQPTF